MSLIHWWPLNGDLKDCGILNTPLTNHNATINNAGKIGKCYTINASKYLSGSDSGFATIFNTNEFSISFWGKVSVTDAQYFIGCGSNFSYQCLHIGLRAGAKPFIGFYSDDFNSSYVCSIDTWYHFTYTVGSGKQNIYINGELIGSRTYTNGLSIPTNSVLNIGFYAGVYMTNGNINDLRIYDHALSAKEIKEISKGLVLHYNFEDEEIEPTTNLSGVIGYEMKCSNVSYDVQFTPAKWGQANGYCINRANGGYCNMPMSEWHKTAGQDGSGFYAWLNRGFTLTEGHTYTVSVYVYSNKATYTNGYICSVNSAALNNYYIVGSGFNLKIGWQRLSYTFTVATGKTATDYCYSPLIYSNPDSEEWIVKLSGFQIEEKNHATPFIAGTRTGKCYDSSGYGYNGTPGSDISISSSSILGTKSLQLSGGTKGNPNSSYIAIPNSPDLNIWTVNIWCNITAWSKLGTAQCLISGKTYDGNYDGYMKITLISQKLGVRATSEGSGYNDYVVCNTSVQLNTPCMLTIVSDGTTLKGYFNGVYEKTVTPDAKYGNKYSPGSIGRAWSDGYWNPDGLISDFKVYSTALSADDIMLEYRRKAAIARNGRLITGLFIEDNSANVVKIDKNDFIKASHIVEYDMNEDYQPVEYIESSGTQYIDTGVNLSSNNFKVDCDFINTVNDYNREQAIFSIWTSAYRYWNVFIDYSKKIDLYTEGHTYGDTVALNTKYNLSLTRNSTTWTLKLGDSTVAKTYSPSSVNTTTLKIFTRGDTPSTSYSNTYIRMFYLKVTIGDQIVRNFIPCYRKSDNVIGLYDTVNKVFYTNQGTGTFTKGPDVNALNIVKFGHKYTALEYIESDGGQAIDTGIKLDMDNALVEIDFQATIASQNGMILASRSDNYWWIYHYNGTGKINCYLDGQSTSQQNLQGPLQDINKHQAIYQNKTYYVDNVKYSTATGSLGITSGNLFMFKWSATDTEFPYKGRIYDCKICNDGVHLTKHFIPAKRNSDNAIGMFDLIERKFYTNVGSGTFTAGPEIGDLSVVNTIEIIED